MTLNFPQRIYSYYYMQGCWQSNIFGGQSPIFLRGANEKKLTSFPPLIPFDNFSGEALLGGGGYCHPSALPGYGSAQCLFIYYRWAMVTKYKHKTWNVFQSKPCYGYKLPFFEHTNLSKEKIKWYWIWMGVILARERVEVMEWFIGNFLESKWI